MQLFSILLLTVRFFFAIPQTPVTNSPFVVKPYIQLGEAAALSKRESLVLAWQSPVAPSEWAVEVMRSGETKWSRTTPPESRRIAIPSIEPHMLYKTTLSDLPPGLDFSYRILMDGKPIFESKARARKSALQPYRVVVFGDCAEGTPGEKQNAYQTSLLNPDFVFIPGDIVYTHGSISEYRKNFFPVYNSDKASPEVGAPLQRSTLFMAAVGNHDVDGRDLGAVPDGMAYFYYWFQPLNGPSFPINAPQTPSVKGPSENTLPFLTAALPQYPRMANYSFEYGNTHWTVLDSNPYTDWTKPPLRDWLEKDLASAQSSTWRVVTFHHPGLGAAFRPDDPRMQQVAAIMAKGRVDIVFNGHLHTYFCSRPIKYDGAWAFDGTYDGVKKTKPEGTIYVISGAGGAHLHEMTKEMMMMNLLARKSIPGKHSLTVADVKGRMMTIRQIGTDGKEIDRFVVTK